MQSNANTTKGHILVPFWKLFLALTALISCRNEGLCPLSVFVAHSSSFLSLTAELILM